MTRLDWRYRLLARIPMLNVDITSMTGQGIARARRRPRSRLLQGRPDASVSWRDTAIPTPAGQLPIRIYEPAGRLTRSPVVVYLHGGGWTLGNLDQVHIPITLISAAANMAVVSVDYRLAPDHPFPAAPDDCSLAVQWVADHADELGVDPDRIAVMGESAGGNLAAAICIVARDKNGPRIAHQTLISPATDLTWSSPSVDDEAHHGILPRPQLERFSTHYLGAADPTHWKASPQFASDLRGLPPAHIIVAQHDTIRDDGIRYAAALRDAGVPVRLTNFASMPHAFVNLNITPTLRRQAIADIAFELRLALESHQAEQGT